MEGATMPFVSRPILFVTLRPVHLQRASADFKEERIHHATVIHPYL
jgi:hypothetical protein